MSQTKKRVLILAAGVLLVNVIVALFVTATAWAFVPAVAITLAIQLAAPLDDDPTVPNHPFKFWLFAAAACGGLVLVVLGLTSAGARELVTGAFLLALSLPSIWVIRQGRNPWWLRGWADYRGR